MNEQERLKAENLPIYQPMKYSDGYDDQGYVEDSPYIPAYVLIKYLKSLEARVRELENKETQCESYQK